MNPADRLRSPLARWLSSALLLALICATSSCKRVLDTPIPAEVGYLAWVHLDPEGRVLEASGLVRADAPFRFTPSGAGSSFLAGYSADQLRMLGAPADERLAAATLFAPLGACDPVLPPPLWSERLSAQGARLGPAELRVALTATWLGQRSCEDAGTADDAGAVGRCVGHDGGASLATHPMGVVDQRIDLPGETFGVAISSAGRVYATALRSTILATELSGGATSTIAVGMVPTDIAFTADGRTALVSNQGDRTLGVLDVAAGRQLRTVPLSSNPFRVRFAPDARELFVTSRAGALHILDPQAQAELAQVLVDPSPNGLVLSPDGARIFVGSVESGTVLEVSRSARRVERRLAVGGKVQDLAISPDGCELYVAVEDGAALVIELATERVSTLTATGAISMVLTPDGEELWLSEQGTQRIQVLDRRSRALLRELRLGGPPRRLAFSAGGDRAAVAVAPHSLVLLR